MLLHMQTSAEILSTEEVSDFARKSTVITARRGLAVEQDRASVFYGLPSALSSAASGATNLTNPLDQIAPARRASTDVSSAGASVVSEGLS